VAARHFIGRERAEPEIRDTPDWRVGLRISVTALDLLRLLSSLMRTILAGLVAENRHELSLFLRRRDA
jgi:hypothetical protein